MPLLRTVIGALVGGEIDRRLDGRGGIAGAAIGAAAVRVATRSIPGALAVGGAALALGYLKSRRDRRRAAGEPAAGAKPPAVAPRVPPAA